ncbi:MAG: epoxyqueuosine reductase [Spirochaetes bacterium]|jgi:epoxyqueuosine reductase|nr:epoxyqueuosine reductase [Spirochaetota bacterium]
MISKNDIINKALEIGFDDIGFTGAEPFEWHLEILDSRSDDYDWAEKAGLKLRDGTDPKKIMPSAKSIIVLIDSYFKKSFPRSLEANFGRCYLDDDRVTKDGLAVKIKQLRNFLRENGVDTRVQFNLPHRAAAARAGLGNFGKNCLFYSARAAKKSSWIIPVTIIADREFESDEPTAGLGCPDWCRNACISACPTRALRGSCIMDPRKCISYMSYFGSGLTPIEYREAMGLYIYGCDRCQNVCPRNSAWLALDLPENEKVSAMADDFGLRNLLHMDADFFTARIWPRMFYIPPSDIWRWKMNAARVMGNSLEPAFIDDLYKAVEGDYDIRVKCMSAWSLGRIGGQRAKKILEILSNGGDDMLKKEAALALEKTGL